MIKISNFVLDLSSINTDTSKVSRLMQKYANDQRDAGMQITGKSFVIQAKQVTVFVSDLKSVLKRESEKQGEDVFGNTYFGLEAYSHAELSVDHEYKRINYIRLLKKDARAPEQQLRYTVFGIQNGFDPTTLNIVSKIAEISSQIKESFDGTSSALKCGDEPSFDTNTFSSNIETGVVWSVFASTYFYPNADIVPTQAPLLPEDMREISKKYDRKSVKTLAELEAEDRELASATLKLNISKTRSGGFELNNAGSAILADTDKLKSEIQGAVGDPVAILNRCYTELFDKFSLGCLIKSAAECIAPPLTCKEMLRGLRVDGLQERLLIAFPNQPRVVELVNDEIQKVRDANPGEEVLIDDILDGIENFVDLEALCDVSKLFQTVGGEIPTIDLPDDLPIVDLYSSISIEIENAILESLVESIKTMIIGILDDLASCDNLDMFVAGALQGNYGTSASTTEELSTLFANGGSTISDALGTRWDEFKNKTDNILQNVVETRLSSSASFLGGSINVQEEITSLGGVSGLAGALAAGDVSLLSGSVLVDGMLQGNLDIDKLLTFEGAGSDSLNQILKEIGRFELSDDGKSFTLQRISDDQVVTIINTASSQPSLAIDIGAEALSNILSSFVEDVVSMLSPGETLELLAGMPTTRVSGLVREIGRTRHPEIDNLGDTVNLMGVLGETTGLNTLRDQVILLSGNDNQRDIPRKYCPEDDERIRLRGEILVNGGLSEEDAKAKIDEIVNTRRDRFNELGTILAKGGDFTPDDILNNIRCGTGKQPDGSRPDVIADQLTSTVNVMFDPIKMSFDREVPKLVDAISSFRKKKKKIARTVSADNDFPIFSETAGSSPLSSFTDFIGGLTDFSIASEKKVNPEFRRLVNEGFIPLKEDGTADGTEAGDSSVTPSFPYTDGGPIEVDDVVRETAGLFKSGIKINQNNVTLTVDDEKFSLDIIGDLKTSSPVDDYISVKQPPQRWLMNYSENGTKYDLRINSAGNIPSKLYGSVPFFENYKFSHEFREDLQPDIRERLDELTENSDVVATRKKVFSLLLSDKVKSALQIGEDRQLLIESAYSNEYDTFVKDFLHDASQTFSRNRLLKKVPNKSLKNLGANMNISAQDDATQLIVLNLISFSPTPTAEQQACKADPHLLDLDFIKDLVKEQFEQECEEGESNPAGSKATRKPINSAGFTGIILTLVRLYVVEYVFRSLFVFDEFGYSESFADDALLNDYISFRIREDIGRLGFWEDFERELLVAYEKLRADGAIVLPTVSAESPESSALIDTQGASTDSTYESETRATVITGLPPQLKNIVKVTLKSVLRKMSTLVGSNSSTEVSLERSFLNSLNVKETYSNFSEGEASSNNQRFLGEDTTKGRFVLERYIRVPRASQIDIRRMQSSPFLRDVVSLNNLDELLVSIEKEPTLSSWKVSDVFGAGWKAGMRLVYVSADFGGEVTDISSNNPFYKKMNLGGPKDLDSDIVDKEKSFYFTEKMMNVAPLDPFDPTNTTEDKYKQLNSVVIASSEIEMSGLGTLKEVAGTIKDTFERNYQQILTEELVKDKDYRLLMKHSLFVERLTSLMVIHSSFAVNSEEMKFLFEGTKLEMRKLFETLNNLGNYMFRSDLGATKNATEYQTQFNRIGHPAGPSGPDALYMAAITPILIFRGIAELLDPNVAISQKIITAAAAGYFAPKLERAQGEISIEGSSNVLNFPEEAIATTNIFSQDATTGKLMVKPEAVEETTEETTAADGTITTTVRRQIKEGLLPGAPITAFTKVMEVELNDDGTPVLDTNNQPVVKTDASGDVIIKSGLGVKGIRIPGGQPSALDAAAAVGGVLEKVSFGTLGLGDINPAFDIVDSVPVYPGESINLPFNIVSPALLPVNVFGLSIPFTFCGPPVNYSLGAPHLMYLEPLLYQMPYFQSIYAKSDVSEDIKKEYNINLSGKEKFVCVDDKKESE